MPLPNATGNQKLLKSVFFNELSSGKSVPRTVFLDLEPKGINDITGGQLGRLFDPDNHIYDERGPGMKGI